MAFNNPNILQLGSRIPQTPKTYTRPSDWISITGVSSGQIIFLVSDAINTKYLLQQYIHILQEVLLVVVGIILGRLR